MDKLLITIVFIGITIVAGIWGLNSLTDSRADLEYERGRSQAMVINAQGQSRLDSAQAAAVTMSAAYPWLITISIVVVVVMAIVFRRSANEPTRYIIERQQTVFILQPGQSRRALYQLLANESQPEFIEHGSEAE